jgi:hypothetical protein
LSDIRRSTAHEARHFLSDIGLLTNEKTAIFDPSYGMLPSIRLRLFSLFEPNIARIRRFSRKKKDDKSAGVLHKQYGGEIASVKPYA